MSNEALLRILGEMIFILLGHQSPKKMATLLRKKARAVKGLDGSQSHNTRLLNYNNFLERGCSDCPKHED